MLALLFNLISGLFSIIKWRVSGEGVCMVIERMGFGPGAVALTPSGFFMSLAANAASG